MPIKAITDIRKIIAYCSDVIPSIGIFDCQTQFILDAETCLRIWEAFLRWLRTQFNSRLWILIPYFGIFRGKHEENNAYLPLLHFDLAFLQDHCLRPFKKNISRYPNSAKHKSIVMFEGKYLAQELSLTPEVLTNAMKKIFNCIGKIAASKLPLSIDFMVGKFVAQGGEIRFNFHECSTFMTKLSPPIDESTSGNKFEQDTNKHSHDQQHALLTLDGKKKINKISPTTSICCQNTWGNAANQVENITSRYDALPTFKIGMLRQSLNPFVIDANDSTLKKRLNLEENFLNQISRNSFDEMTPDNEYSKMNKHHIQFKNCEWECIDSMSSKIILGITTRVSSGYPLARLDFSRENCANILDELPKAMNEVKYTYMKAVRQAVLGNFTQHQCKRVNSASKKSKHFSSAESFLCAREAIKSYAILQFEIPLKIYSILNNVPAFLDDCYNIEALVNTFNEPVFPGSFMKFYMNRVAFVKDSICNNMQPELLRLLRQIYQTKIESSCKKQELKVLFERLILLTNIMLSDALRNLIISALQNIHYSLTLQQRHMATSSRITSIIKVYASYNAEGKNVTCDRDIAEFNHCLDSIIYSITHSFSNVSKICTSQVTFNEHQSEKIQAEQTILSNYGIISIGKSSVGNHKPGWLDFSDDPNIVSLRFKILNSLEECVDKIRSNVFSFSAEINDINKIDVLKLVEGIESLDGSNCSYVTSLLLQSEEAIACYSNVASWLDWSLERTVSCSPDFIIVDLTRAAAEFIEASNSHADSILSAVHHKVLENCLNIRKRARRITTHLSKPTLTAADLQSAMDTLHSAKNEWMQELKLWEWHNNKWILLLTKYNRFSAVLLDEVCSVRCIMADLNNLLNEGDHRIKRSIDDIRLTQEKVKTKCIQGAESLKEIVRSLQFEGGLILDLKLRGEMALIEAQSLIEEGYHIINCEALSGIKQDGWDDVLQDIDKTKKEIKSLLKFYNVAAAVEIALEMLYSTTFTEISSNHFSKIYKSLHLQVSEVIGSNSEVFNFRDNFLKKVMQNTVTKIESFRDILPIIEAIGGDWMSKSDWKQVSDVVDITVTERFPSSNATEKSLTWHDIKNLGGFEAQKASKIIFIGKEAKLKKTASKHTSE